MIILKKLKLNIEYIGSKTKKYYKYDLTSLPKKLINYLKPSRLRAKIIIKKAIKQISKYIIY